MIKRISALILALIFICMIITGCGAQTAGDTPETPGTATIQNKPEKTPGASAAENESEEPPSTTATQASDELGVQAYEYLSYIDENLHDRDCIDGDNYMQSRQWILRELQKAGYSKNDIHTEDFTFENESDDGDAQSVDQQNIWVTKKGTSGRQIIIGAHYDGTGTGDNGSGTALALAAAAEFCNAEPFYDLTFVFFSAEEYGLYGSAAYAADMSPEQIENTEYMINMDSILSGDYCYIYGGAADFDELTVNDTQAYEIAMQTARELGLRIRSNPWTFSRPEPSAEDGVPAYPSPATGDWSDHVAFRDLGIPYVYFEATNWEIGDFDGYDETEDAGPIIHTENDNLEAIESFFPGRAQENINTFAALLEALLEQGDLEF